jgi:type II secretory pathway component PulC
VTSKTYSAAREPKELKKLAVEKAKVCLEKKAKVPALAKKEKVSVPEKRAKAQAQVVKALELVGAVKELVLALEPALVVERVVER